ncbi:DUF6300 family protein [Streptomyces sp. WAC01280]|uniref:DUF6300 family protein n=1 Tax=Streptomyces sp. WAC01280 TaxID=2487424 RepID=UPI00163BF88A|nr:DUF6300 family protein [Streptomyces sp. WAC01280]
MAMVEAKKRLPLCSRCRGNLIISAVAPMDDAHGRPIHLELCPACDTGDTERPAAGLLLQWCADSGGHDLSRVEEGTILLLQ